MFRVFLTVVLQESRAVSTGASRYSAGAHADAFVHRLPAAGRSSVLGGDRGHQHGARTPLLDMKAVGKQLGMTPYNDVRFALLGGSIVDANALVRPTFGTHRDPGFAATFMIVHFWRVRKEAAFPVRRR